MAKVAETAIGSTAAQGDTSVIMDEIRASRAEVRQLTNRIDKMSVGQITSRSPTPDSRRVKFAPNRWSPVRNDANRRGHRHATTPSGDKSAVVRSVGDPSERRRRDHSHRMDHIATIVVGHITTNIPTITVRKHISTIAFISFSIEYYLNFFLVLCFTIFSSYLFFYFQ